MFHESFCDFLMGGPSSNEKKLRQNFPIFVSRVLVTWTGDLFTTHFSRENRVFCDLRTIFKKISVFPHSFWLFIFLSVHLSHKLTMFLTKIHHFSSSSLLQTSRKGMGFLFFSKHFMFITFDFMILELLRFEKWDVWIWVGFTLLRLVNRFYWYWFYDDCFICFHVCFSFFSMILD